MKVIIVGDTGFLGYYAALEFLRRGHKVSSISIPDITLGSWYPKEIKSEYCDVFVTDEAELVKRLKGYDAIVYAVGPDHRIVPPAPAYPFYHERLVEACGKTISAERKAERYFEKSGLPYTILRLPTVLGGNDTFVSQAIIPRLQNGTFYFAGKRDPQFSLLYVKNLGPIVRRLIEIGPQNDVFNCTDHSITWKEFIAEYAWILQIPLPDQKKSILSMLRQIQDKKYVYMMVNSYFGAHFPNEKLMQRIQFTPPFPWQAGVSEAIAAYMETQQNPTPPHPHSGAI